MSIAHSLPSSLTLTLNGSLVDAETLGLLQEMRVVQKLSLPNQCELTFLASPLAALRARFTLGATVRLDLGHGMPPLFCGEVTALEQGFDDAHGNTFRVRAYDVLHRLRKQQPFRVHEQADTRTILETLTGGLGLSIDTTETGPTWAYLLQAGKTNFELLADTAAQGGLHFHLQDKSIRLFSLEGRGPAIPLAQGYSLHSVNIEINAERACRNVAARAWAPGIAAPVRGTAARPRSGRTAKASAPPATVGGCDQRMIPNALAESEGMAEAMAQAELDERIAGEVVVRGTADGDPRIVPGCCVALSGIPDDVTGTYVVTEATHLIGARVGFVTEFSTSPPKPARPRGPEQVMLGVISAVTDPDGRGRVKANLPSCDGLETDWMPVLIPGAGAGKGIVALPDVGDSVLLLCNPDNLGHGIVLGGLAAAPAGMVVGDRVRKFVWRTPGGHQLRFDDSAQSLRLESSNGSFLEMNDSEVRLHAALPLTLSAPGLPLVVEAAMIDFKRR